MTTRQLTTWQLFVRDNASLRPPTTTPSEWMRELGRRWRNRNEDALIPNIETTENNECTICFDEKSLVHFNDGPCQHHKDICREYVGQCG